jgi:phospholipid/cholesterol/gamma-HCH transport system substrate-binding protein
MIPNLFIKSILQSNGAKLNENLEALKHNFLFRGFRRLERKKKRTALKEID